MSRCRDGTQGGCRFLRVEDRANDQACSQHLSWANTGPKPGLKSIWAFNSMPRSYPIFLQYRHKARSYLPQARFQPYLLHSMERRNKIKAQFFPKMMTLSNIFTPKPNLDNYLKRCFSSCLFCRRKMEYGQPSIFAKNLAFQNKTLKKKENLKFSRF